MPGIAVIDDVTTGHEGYPPTKMVTSPVSKTKFNGKKPGVVDPACQFLPHTKGNSTHPQNIRYPVEGSTKTKIEGYYLARIGDKLADGDVIAKGSDNSFIE
jgi:uncharacterized Zn-binding protein involved in type VI secretion